MSPKAVVFALSSTVMLVLDQASKAWVRANLSVHDERPIIANFLSIAHAKNPGAAFSALADFKYRYIVFYAFTAIAVGVLIQGYRQLRDNDRFQGTAMGLILAGALGNFIDRVMSGEVTDMVKVYAGAEPYKSWAIQYSPYHSNVYPIWNVADAAIVVGVGMFALSYLFEKDKPEAGAKAPGESAPQVE